jgi:DNA polymerase III epsilon subunit-like protein
MTDWDHSFIAWDTETTGLSDRARILSFGAVRFRGGVVVQEAFLLIRPEGVDWASDETRRALDVNRLRREDVEQGLPFPEAYLAIRRLLCSERIWVGHFLQFDMRMLRQEEARLALCGIPLPDTVLDTHALHVAVTGVDGRHGLAAACEQQQCDVTGDHTSLHDALAAGRLYWKMRPHLPREPDKLIETQQLAARAWEAAKTAKRTE